MMKLLIMPNYPNPDTKGDGGIRRIVEAQIKYLPAYGIQMVDTIEEADIVALHAGDWPRAAEIPASTPIVAHCHGLYWSEYQWGIGATAVNNRVVHNLLRADGISVCSEFVKRAVQKALWLDPDVIYHGIDMWEWENLPIRHISQDEGGYVLWNKARVDAVCDPRPVIELALRLTDVHFATTFVPQDRGTPDNVAVTGAVSYAESQRMTKAADVYLGTTRGTFDISVVEAMACGVPVLGWNWGSLPEIVMHKVHGYLAEPGNYDDLVAGYWYIQANRARMSTACVKRVNPMFTWPYIMKYYAALYAKVQAEALAYA